MWAEYEQTLIMLGFSTVLLLKSSMHVRLLGKKHHSEAKLVKRNKKSLKLR